MNLRKLILTVIILSFMTPIIISYSADVDTSPYFIASDVSISSGDALYVVLCKVSVSLRSQPATDASTITQVPLYSKVTYLGKAGNGFLYVDYKGYKGYILSSYLDYMEPQNAVSNYGIIVNVNEYASLRKLPSTDADVYAEIPKGATVTDVADNNRYFYSVSYNGMKGYVLKSLVQLYTDQLQNVQGTYYSSELNEYIDITAYDPKTITVEIYDYSDNGNRTSLMKVNYVKINNKTWSSVAGDYGRFSLSSGAQVITYDGHNTIAFVPYGYPAVYYQREPIYKK